MNDLITQLGGEMEPPFYPFPRTTLNKPRVMDYVSDVWVWKILVITLAKLTMDLGPPSHLLLFWRWLDPLIGHPSTEKINRIWDTLWMLPPITFTGLHHRIITGTDRDRYNHRGLMIKDLIGLQLLQLSDPKYKQYDRVLDPKLGTLTFELICQDPGFLSMIKLLCLALLTVILDPMWFGNVMGGCLLHPKEYRWENIKSEYIIHSNEAWN